MIFLAPFLFNLTGLIDTYLVKRFGQEEQEGNLHHSIGTLTIFAAIIWAVSILVFLPRIWNDFVASFHNSAMVRLLLAGIVSSGGGIAYFYALQQEKIENIIPFYQTIPLWSMILGAMFLGESVSTMQTVIICGIIVLTMLFGFDTAKQTRNTTALLLILLSAILYALRSILFKYGGNQEDNFLVAVAREHIGTIIIWLYYRLQPKIRRSTISYINHSGWKFASLNITNEILYILAIIILNFASLSQYVVIVSLLSNGIQPLLGFAMSYGAHRLLPGIYERHYSQKTLIFKIVITLIILCLLWVFFSL